MGHFCCKEQKIQPNCHKPKELCYLITMKPERSWLQAWPNWSSVSAFLHLSVQLSFPVMIVFGLRFDNKIVASSSSLTSFHVQVQNKSKKNIPSHSHKHHIAFSEGVCACVKPIIMSKGNPVL